MKNVQHTSNKLIKRIGQLKTTRNYYCYYY